MQWKMLQQKDPKDYVISTGRQESVRRFIQLAALALGWKTNSENNAIVWEGSG